MEKSNIEFSVELNELIEKIEQLEKLENLNNLDYINNIIELSQKLRAYANRDNYSTCFTKAIFYLNKADEKCDLLLRTTNSDKENIVLAKAECNKNISNIYLGWGHEEMSVMYATNVINILEEEFGANSEKVRFGYENINSVLAYFRKPKEGIEFANKHLSLCKKVYGEQSVEVSKQLTGIGHIYRSINEFEKCLEYFKKALQICQTILEPTHVEIAKCYYNLGFVHADTSEVEKSVDYYKKALDVFKIVLGEESEEVIDTLQAAAYQSVRIGQMSDAENYYNTVQSTLINKYGEKSEKLIPFYCNVGVFYKKQYNYDKAITVFTNAKEIIEENELFNDYDLCYIQSQLGYSTMNKGKYEIAKNIFEDALKIGKEQYKVDEVRELEILEALYYCLDKLKADFNECNKCLNKIIELKSKFEDVTKVDKAKFDLGVLYKRFGKKDKSIECFEELINAINSRKNSDKLLIIDSYKQIGEIHYQHGDYDKGLEYFEEALVVAKKLKEQDALVVEDIYLYIAEKYSQLENEEKALEYFNNALKHKEKHEGSVNHNLYILNNDIANHYIKNKNKDLAKKYLFEANNIYMKLYKALPYENLSLMCDYGLLFLNKDEYLEAVSILEVFLKSNSQNIYYSKYYGQVLRLLDYLETKFQVSANAFGREVLLKQMALFAEKRLELLELADDKNYDDIAECCCTIGYAYFELRDSAKVLEYGLKEYEILKEHLSDDTSRIASALVNIGCAFDEECTYEGNLKCLDYNIQAFKLDQTSELISSNIAGFYVETDNFEQAEKFMELALISAEEKGIDYKYKVAEVESNFTHVYVDWYCKNKSEDHFNNAIEHFNNSLSLYEKLSIKGHLNIENCFNHELAELHVYIGKLFIEKGIHLKSVDTLDKAFEYLNKSKEYFLTVYDENNNDLTHMYYCFGKGYIYKGLLEKNATYFDLALENIEKCLNIRKNEYSENHPLVLEVYGLLAMCYYKKSEVVNVDCNFEKVLEYGNRGLNGVILHFGENSFRQLEMYDFLIEVYKKLGNIELLNIVTKEAERVRGLIVK